MNSSDLNPQRTERRNEINRVTLVGSLANLLLSMGKLAAGIFGRSHAMVADAIHSFSDLGTDIAVLVGIYLASHPEDKGHNYGHGKYETFATLIIAISLLSVGIGIGWSGIEKIIGFFRGETIPVPGIVAFIAAVLSIVVKEILFRYTQREGKRLQSSAMEANAFHHRSDALSSVGTGIGILGAILLGNNWVLLDPIAAVIVSVLILKEAIHIGYTSVNDLLEASIPEEDQKKILKIASGTVGVIDPHNLKTRRIGTTIALDFHIRVDDTISVREGHDIAHNVEKGIFKEFGNDVICSIHVEPESILHYYKD